MGQGAKFLLRAVLFSIVVLAGCNNPAHRHADKKVFRYNEAGGITSLDPAFANNEANTRACMQLYNGLVQADSQLRIQPCIARSWDVLEKGKVFVFHLRNDIFFHENNSFDVREEFNVIHNKDVMLQTRACYHVRFYSCKFFLQVVLHSSKILI